MYRGEKVDPFVINPNGNSPSECRHFICWCTKGHLWIEGCLKHYRWACYEIHSLSIQLAIFYLFICQLLYTNFPISNSRTYVTFPKAYHVLYASIVIATRVQICTWVSLIATCMSYAGCQYQYLHMPSFDIKNNKSRLMEMC